MLLSLLSFLLVSLFYWDYWDYFYYGGFWNYSDYWPYCIYLGWLGSIGSRVVYELYYKYPILHVYRFRVSWENCRLYGTSLTKKGRQSASGEGRKPPGIYPGTTKIVAPKLVGSRSRGPQIGRWRRSPRVSSTASQAGERTKPPIVPVGDHLRHHFLGAPGDGRPGFGDGCRM